MREKPVDHDLADGAHAHQIDRFTKRAFHDRLPEQVDHPLRLAGGSEPFQGRGGVRSILGPQPRYPKHAAGEGELLTHREVPHPEEQRSEVERRR